MYKYNIDNPLIHIRRWRRQR